MGRTGYPRGLPKFMAKYPLNMTKKQRVDHQLVRSRTSQFSDSPRRYQTQAEWMEYNHRWIMFELR